MACGLLGLLAAASIPVAADPELKLAQLRLDQAQNLALAANPDLAAALDRSLGERASVGKAGALPNPVLGLRHEDADTIDDVGIVELSQKLEVSGVRGARRRAASFGAESADWSLRQVRVGLYATVRRSFAEVLAGQQRLELAQEDAAIADSLAQVVSRRVAAGQVSPVEETRARLITGSAHIEQEQAQQQLSAAHARLLALWDGAPGFDQAVGSLKSVDVLPPWTDLELRIAKLPAVQEAEAGVKLQQANLDLERARRIPDPTVEAGYKKFSARREESYLVAITVPLPVFDWNSAGIAAARARLDEATEARRARLAALRADILNAYQGAGAAYERAGLLETDMVPAAQSAFEATRIGYEQGKFGLLELLDTQRTLQQIKQQLLQAQLDAATARAELDRLIDFSGETAAAPPRPTTP